MTERAKIIKLLHSEMTLKVCRRQSDVDTLAVPALCRKLVSCIGSLDYDFDKVVHPYVLKISIVDCNDGQLILDPKVLVQFLNSNCSPDKALIEIDYQGRLVSVSNESFSDYTEAVAYSELNKDFMFFIWNRTIHVMVSGVCVDFVSNASAHKPSTAVSGTELHIDEWSKILSRYEETLKGQKRFFFWAAPKDEGKLINSPEKHFRKDLAKFIQENTINCFVDEEAYNDHAEDRVDIRVITCLDQNVYYFELKCLGVCVGGTTYTENHAFEGLSQTSTYVENDNHSVLGVLVIFDARSSHTDLKWPDKLVKKLHSKVSMPPKHMKIEPSSASVKAKKIVRDALRP